MNGKTISINIAFFVLLICSYSCGDVFEQNKRITGNYYLGESDQIGGPSIYFKTTDGSYFGRSPAKVIEYGFTGDFIISKNETNYGLRFYLIDRKKDFLHAEESDFLIGPLTEKEYDSLKMTLNLHLVLKKV